MNNKVILALSFFVLTSVTAQAQDVNAPSILSSVAEGSASKMSSSEMAKIRGEYIRCGFGGSFIKCKSHSQSRSAGRPREGWRWSWRKGPTYTRIVEFHPNYYVAR